MRKGLATSLVGAVVYLTAASLLPWQRFELARLDTTSLALGPLAWLAFALVAAILAVSTHALATHRLVRGARVVLGASLVLAVGLVALHAERDAGLRIMRHETIVMGAGFFAALVGLATMFAGAAAAIIGAPTWDEATPVLRLRATGGGRAPTELVVYEPRPIALARELACAELEAVALRLTREGELELEVPPGTRVAVDGRGGRGRRPGRARLMLGDRAVVTRDAVELHVDYVRQPREGARRLVLGSEAAALALGALLVLLATGVASVLGREEKAVRLVPDAERRTAIITALTEDERRAEQSLAIDTALLERATTTAKAAGGEEGRFGDPEAPPERPTKVPPRDGRQLERAPDKIGLLATLADPQVDRAIAELVSDDGTFAAKLAWATAGTDEGLSLGPGANGLSIIGDGDGGPGDGTGRLLGLGPIDTGPGRDRVLVQLEPRPKKRVPHVDMPAPDPIAGYCKRADIESVVRRRAGAIRSCYEQRLQVDEGLKGKLSVRWTIGADGKVSAANATSDTLGDTATRQCVLRAVSNMRFPAPDGGGLCIVQWPFIFNPG